MYIDFDYMDRKRDFSYDHKRFDGLPELIRDTKAQHNIRWAFIVDPGIDAFNDPKENPPFTDGYNKDVFITWDKKVPKEQRQKNPSGVPLDKGLVYGNVWSGPVAFPDFFKNVTHEWWQKWIKYFHNDLNVKFDALWIVRQLSHKSIIDNTLQYRI